MSVDNFSWVIPKLLAGCAMPIFSWRDDAAWLYGQGVDMLVSHVMPDSGVKEACANCGIEWVYFPITDFDVPDNPSAYSDLIDKIVDAMKNDRGVCVHCRAGVGRTGMTLACAVGRYLSLPHKQAVEKVRAARASIETAQQEMFAKVFLSDNP